MYANGKFIKCPGDCFNSKGLEKQYATVKMWSQINARKRQRRYEENRIKFEKEKDAKRKHLEKGARRIWA